jgi:hypothetical protein
VPACGDLAPILFLLVLAFGVPGANAVVLGELRSSARVGQVLQAEIEVSEHPAERFDPACLKLFRPQSASDDLPWITEARLSYRREGGHGRLTIVSRAAITDPAVRLGVRSECAAGASRQYTILLADPMGVVASPPTPGAAPATALGKTDSRPAAVAAARPPAAAIPAQRPPVAVGESVRAGRAAAAKGEAAPLSASDELSEPVTTSGLGRELLRLEQRALAMLNDPADDQETMSNKLAWLEANVAELKRATERLQGGAAALPGGDPAGEPRLPAAGAGSASAPPVAAALGGAPLAAATVPATGPAGAQRSAAHGCRIRFLADLRGGGPASAALAVTRSPPSQRSHRAAAAGDGASACAGSVRRLAVLAHARCGSSSSDRAVAAPRDRARALDRALDRTLDRALHRTHGCPVSRSNA